jgi:hypothetical protein
MEIERVHRLGQAKNEIVARRRKLLPKLKAVIEYKTEMWFVYDTLHRRSTNRTCSRME